MDEQGEVDILLPPKDELIQELKSAKGENN